MTRAPRPHLFWRIVIVFAATVLLWIGLHAVRVAVGGPDYDRQSHIVMAVLVTVLAVPLVLAARRFLDRRPLSGLGLQPWRGAWRPFLVGALCWAAPAAVGIGLCLVLGWVEITPVLPPGEILLRLALLVVLVLLLEALPEELVFRGYLQRNLSTAMAPWLAALAQAGLFTLFGVLTGAAETVDRVVLFFGFSLVIGLVRVVTGSVWACVGFHLVFQTVAQFLGPMWDAFTVTDMEVLQTVGFGLLPFGLAVLLAQLLHRRPVNWSRPEPDEVTVAARP